MPWKTWYRGVCEDRCCRRSGLSCTRGGSQFPSFLCKAMDASPPDIFVCPISRDIMHDPVVLIETGQIYDRESINGWFERGCFTCPMTGTRLISRSLISLHSLRESITHWAEESGVTLSAPDYTLREDQELGSLDNPSKSLMHVLSKGVSIYDVEGLSRMIGGDSVMESYASMVVLRELVQHAGLRNLKDAEKIINIRTIKGLLWDDRLQVPAARLLTRIKGALDVDELLSLLVIQNVELQVDVVTRLVEHICENRGHMQVAAGIVRRWITGIVSRLKRLNSPRRQQPPMYPEGM